MENQQTPEFALPEEFENQGASQRFSNWIKNHSRAITSLIIVAVIVGVGIYAYNKPQVEESATTAESSEIAQPTEETQPAIEISQPTESPVAPTIPAVTSNTQPQPVTRAVEVKEDQIVVSAGSGDGVTHLARQALKEYIKTDSGIKLSAEQKIYIEDYLKDKTSSQKLAIGNSKNFSKDIVKQAIEASQKLNEKQIQNLGKYVKLVPELT